MIKCNNFGSMSALPVSQVQIAGYAYQINYLAYLVDKLQQTVTNLDPEDQGEAISTLQAEVAELREAIQGAGGNMYVAVPSQITCASTNTIYVTYDTLPDGAVLDKIELSLNLSGMTVPTKVDILITSQGGVSTVADGGYASWTVVHNVNGGTTITTLTITTNTLYNHNITSSDFAVWGRLYYHV